MSDDNGTRHGADPVPGEGDAVTSARSRPADTAPLASPPTQEFPEVPAGAGSPPDPPAAPWRPFDRPGAEAPPQRPWAAPPAQPAFPTQGSFPGPPAPPGPPGSGPGPGPGSGSWQPPTWGRPAVPQSGGGYSGFPQGPPTQPLPGQAAQSSHAAAPGPTAYSGGAAYPAPTTAYPAQTGHGGPTTYPGQPAPPSGPAYPSPTAVPPAGADRGGRRGPGWGAVAGIAVACTALAGLGGGLVGGWAAGNEPGSEPSASGSATPGTPARPDGTVANIAARTTPSVVTIKVEAADGSGTGSGWVYDRSGHIVTNNHVVTAGSNPRITVVLSNGKRLPATVQGHDASYDLAVVKVNGLSATPIPVGASAGVVVGDPVIAVGAPLGLDSTVTTGIVSALDRPVSTGENAGDRSFISAIQTDAAINPGNSGGPLLDMKGQVIGVNSAIARVPTSDGSGTGGNIGVGFAIPSDQVKRTVDQLITTGKAEHPVIGVVIDSAYDGEGVRIDDNAQGVQAVTPGGPAEKAGIKPGDLVLAFEGKPVNDPDTLVVRIRSRAVGDKVRLTIRRDGKEFDVTMTLQGRT